MIDDLDSLDGTPAWRTAVCIVGGGMAGIAIALELDRLGVDCVLLESGGLRREPGPSALNAGTFAGLPFLVDEGTRCRFLGGSSNCWGGCCRPFDPIDFEPRPWVPHSGWPLTRTELMPWYRRASRLVDIPATDYDPDAWIPPEAPPHFRRMRFDDGDVEDQVFAFSYPTRFGSKYRSALERARRVRVLLHANAVAFEASPDGRETRTVRVRSLSGRRLEVRAAHVVLAAGGVENVRLLLDAGLSRPDAFGHPHDQVGRYFMDHPRLCAGRVRFARAVPHPFLYDQFFYYNGRVRRMSPDGTAFGGHFVLSPQAQRREGILNAQTWFRSFAPGEDTAATRPLVRLRLRLLGAQFGEVGAWSDLATVAGDPLAAAGFALTRTLGLTGWIREVRLNTIVEPEPDPDSRIVLSDALDALGKRRVEVRWRLGPLVRRTFDRTWAVIAASLERAGIATVELPEPIEDTDWAVPDTIRFWQSGLGRLLEQDDGWPRMPDWTWHHMGGTRMSDSPRTGVVDRDLRVHGMANTWVCGSSVFPTAGANFPTLTLLALALRLATQLATRVKDEPRPVQSGTSTTVAAS